MSGITKRFLDITAGDNINFSLFAGEICALLGENGAGKTTLMNILFGYYTCDEGQIFIKGKKAALSAPKDAIGRGVGMIRQHFALVPSQTVLENIIVGTGSGNGIFLDLKSARRDIVALQERFGLQAIQALVDETALEINYPVLEYPVKVSSFNLDKVPVAGGQLMGVKGQYLIFDGGVINMRKYGGYHLSLSTL